MVQHILTGQARSTVHQHDTAAQARECQEIADYFAPGGQAEAEAEAEAYADRYATLVHESPAFYNGTFDYEEDARERFFEAMNA